MVGRGDGHKSGWLAHDDQAGAPMVSLDKPHPTITDVLEEVHERLGVKWSEIERLTGRSRSHIHRIRTSHKPLRAGELMPLAEEFGLPKVQLLYINMLTALSPEEREHYALPEPRRAVLGEGRYLTDIKIPEAHWKELNEADPVKRAAGVIAYSIEREIPETSWQGRPGCIYSAQSGTGLVQHDSATPVIPDGAVVEVDVTEARPASGSVVFAQLDGGRARAYLYTFQNAPGGMYERFRSAQGDPIAVKHERRTGVDSPLAEQRVIIGAVTRIVHYAVASR